MSSGSQPTPLPNVADLMNTDIAIIPKTRGELQAAIVPSSGICYLCIAMVLLLCLGVSKAAELVTDFGEMISAWTGITCLRCRHRRLVCFRGKDAIVQTEYASGGGLHHV